MYISFISSNSTLPFNASVSVFNKFFSASKTTFPALLFPFECSVRSFILLAQENAVSVAEKYNLPYVDLYSVLVDKPDYYTNDGVHLNEDGYKALVREIYQKINEVL